MRVDRDKAASIMPAAFGFTVVSDDTEGHNDTEGAGSARLWRSVYVGLNVKAKLPKLPVPAALLPAFVAD